MGHLTSDGASIFSDDLTEFTLDCPERFRFGEVM